MALPNLDWVQAIEKAAQSNLGFVSLGLVVVFFVVLAVGGLKAGHKLVVIVVIVALVAFFGYLVLRPDIDPPVPISGCVIKDQAITVNKPVRLNAAGLTLTLLGTTQEDKGPIPRGANLKVSTETKPQYVEAKDGATPMYIGSTTYDVWVKALRQESAVVSLCRR